MLTMSVFGAGFALFAHPWPGTRRLSSGERNNGVNKAQIGQMQISNVILTSPIFQEVLKDSDFLLLTVDELIPQAHRNNHVGQGLLGSPNHLDVGPLLFLNKSKGQMYAFCHLGPSLEGGDGKVHNGILATLLDESLCFCGFDKLPSKRGVTAQLTINFKDKVHLGKNGTDVILSANVKEWKGRKCIIDGKVQTLERNPTTVADATCVLVEPKWFKWLSWVDLF